MNGEIINRVAASPLITFDLADYYDRAERAEIDLKENLFMGQILREKDFREFVKNEDWSRFTDKNVRIFCSVDAIIPAWAFMLLAISLEPFAKTIVMGTREEQETRLFLDQLNKVDFSQFEGKKIVVKGCGDIAIPNAVFVELTRRLRPLADKIMYGEPCSSVPLYKR